MTVKGIHRKGLQQKKKRPSRRRRGLGRRRHFPIHTPLSFGIGLLALGILIFLGVRYLRSGDEYGQRWGSYALFQAFLCALGLFVPTYLTEKRLIPSQFRARDPNTGVQAVILVALMLFTQIFLQTWLTYEIATFDRALYLLFAAVGEELFFRLFIMELLEYTSKSPLGKLIAVPISVTLFTAIHVNYYNNLPALASVFGGGLILAIAYYVWDNITANILAHFYLNAIAVGSLLVRFAIQFPLDWSWMLWVVSGILILVLLRTWKVVHHSPRWRIYLIAVLVIVWSVFLIQIREVSLTLPPEPKWVFRSGDLRRLGDLKWIGG